MTRLILMSSARNSIARLMTAPTESRSSRSPSMLERSCVMPSTDLEWVAFAPHLDGVGFARFQRELTNANRRRLEPKLPHPQWRDHIDNECRVLRAEGEFVEAVR